MIWNLLHKKRRLGRQSLTALKYNIFNRGFIMNQNFPFFYIDIHFITHCARMGRLSKEEYYAYHKMLWHDCMNWDLPGDPERLAGQLNSTVEAIEGVLTKFGDLFEIDDGTIHHVEVTEAKQRAAAKSEANRIAGRLGGKAKAKRALSKRQASAKRMSSETLAKSSALTTGRSSGALEVPSALKTENNENDFEGGES